MEKRDSDEQQAWDTFVAAALSGAMVGSPTAWRSHVANALEAADALIVERRRRRARPASGFPGDE